MRYRVLDQQGINFFTCTIVEWIDLFTRSAYSDIVIDSLVYCQREKGLKVHAYVIMSNHVHLVVSTNNPKGISNIIQSFKSFTARRIIKFIKEHSKRESRGDWLLSHFAFNARTNSRNSNYQVWKKDNHPFVLFSPKLIRQKINYIHNNPVKAKIVARPEDYLYSSASNYANGKGLLKVDLLEDIWNDVGFINTGI